MSVRGLRVHIAGSAATSADRALLMAAHEFVSSLTERLIEAGAGLVLGVGNEPLGDAGLPCTFDWTILEAISSTKDPRSVCSGQPGRFRVVASQRALDRIPDSRRAVWANCTGRTDFELELSAPGWRMGGVIRAAQVLRGDVLVVLGGGAGVEQLAQLCDEGKPVIPIRCAIGAYSHDGSGGGSCLHNRALSEPGTFFELRAGAGSAAARLVPLEIGPAEDPASVAETLASVLAHLKPPRAFYIRLLDTGSVEFEPVETIATSSILS